MTAKTKSTRGVSYMPLRQDEVKAEVVVETKFQQVKVRKGEVQVPVVQQNRQGVRPVVGFMAILMERALGQLDDQRSLPDWQDCDPRWLFNQLVNEAEELHQALQIWVGTATSTKRLDDMKGAAMWVSQKAANVANFAAMITDVTGGLEVTRDTPLSRAAQPDSVPGMEGHQ